MNLPIETRPVTEQAPVDTATEASGPMADQITGAAAHLFSRLGYHAVGIRQLADAVGITPSTLYHYYRTKQDILFAVIDRFLGEFNETLVPPLRDTSVAPDVRLEHAFVTHVVMTVRNREQLLVGNPVLNALTTQQQAAIARRRRAYRDAVRDVIAEGVAAGQFSASDPLLTAMAVLDMLDGVRAWFHDGAALSLEEMADRYCAFALALCRGGA